MALEYVTFGEMNSLEDWGLIKVTDEIGYPVPSASFDELALYGLTADQYDVEESRRELHFTFRALDAEPFPGLVDEITAYLHGQKLKIRRSIDPESYYLGRCAVNQYKTVKRVGTLVIDVNAEPYKYGDRVTETFSGLAGKTLTVDTDYITPAVVEITPSVGMTTLTITGLAYNGVTGAGESIKLNALQSGVKIIIDGEKKTITKANGQSVFSSAEFWEFPSLKPGNNTISLSNSNLAVSVAYTPRRI